MDLKDFIKESLSQIVHGIIEADKAMKDTGAAVNPLNVVIDKTGLGPYGHLVHNQDGFRQAVESIAFDVVVTATEGKETQGGIGVDLAKLP